MALVRRLTNALLPLKPDEKRPTPEAAEMLFSGSYERIDTYSTVRDELNDPMVQARVRRVERVALPVKAALAALCVSGFVYISTEDRSASFRIQIGETEVPDCEDAVTGAEVLIPVQPAPQERSTEGMVICELAGATFQVRG